MPFRRRRSMRMSAPRQVIQSYKKVLNFAPVSQGAGSRNINLAFGVENATVGQTSVTDDDVPTGCIIKSFTIQVAYGQIVGGAVFMNWSIQKLHANQSAIASNVIGGNPQRNQVFKQGLVQLGLNQTFTQTIHFKIPPKFQRMREEDKWVLQLENSNTVVEAVQVIYKFYR